MKKIFQKIKKAYELDLVKIGSVFLLFFSLFALVYFSIDRIISNDDPLFHIRFAELIRERGFGVFLNFPWIYFSKIAQHQQYFIYYNFLFYLALIPFTFMTPLIIGVKLYGVFGGALAFTVLYYFLFKTKEKHAFFWTVFLFTIITSSSVLRFMLARPFTLAPALLLIELYFLSKKYYGRVFLITIIYFYWHTATFFFPIMIAGIYFLFENFYGKKLNWKIMYASISGVLLSIILSLSFAPGLFYYLRNIIFSVIYDTIIGKKVNLAEGMEVYPVNFIDFINRNSFVVVLLFIAISLEIYLYIESKKGRNPHQTAEDVNRQPIVGALFLTSIAFFLGTFLSQRNKDFFVFFSAAYISMRLNYILGFIQVSSVIIKRSLITGIFVASGYLLLANLLMMQNDIVSNPPYSLLQGTAGWLKENTEKGSVVFLSSWNWFTELFYYDTDNNYVMGIEPRFLYDYDPQMYWEWWHITQNGYACSQDKCDDLAEEKRSMIRNNTKKQEWFIKEGAIIGDVLKNKFQSEFIVTSSDFSEFNSLLDGDKEHFEKVYTDPTNQALIIYRVK
jgi:hypothetical protein